MLISHYTGDCISSQFVNSIRTIKSGFYSEPLQIRFLNCRIYGRKIIANYRQKAIEELFPNQNWIDPVLNKIK